MVWLVLLWWVIGIFSAIGLCISANNWRSEFQFKMTDLAFCASIGLGGLIVTVVWILAWLIALLNENDFWNKVIFTWKNK